MNVRPYTYFSELYSFLMKSIDYPFWSNYIKEIHETIGNKNDVALELASGNCKLSEELKSQFRKLYVTDISLQMLQKNLTLTNKICCDMVYLPFKIKFDFIYSTFDSINYLADEVHLNKFFNNIGKFISKKGFFVFDVSLKKNSLKHLKKLNRKGEYNNIKFEQISTFDKKTMIHSNIINFELEDGKKFSEVHNQKIYDFYYYFDVIDSNNLLVVECFDAFDFKNGSPDSERIQFIVKRKK
ncbi:MAG: methyltransferase domain-containing protein [Ignavibacteriae bacterium]|nr:methyltransferase domain-containing protein [Ignavibacteriota bacterium]